jgi:hypothetical protein
MTALASTDVTVTISERRIVGKKRRNIVKIVFGDGALTYPAGGVPMPAYTGFGMIRNLDYLNIVDQDDATGIYWKYDKDNNKLRAYTQGYAVGAAGAATLDDFPVTAAFNVTSGISVSLTNSAGSATNGLGALVEAATGATPAASQTLYAEAVGW